MTAAAPDVYERLAALGTCALELARAGRLHELAGCQEARDALIATLPPAAPPEARPALERCLAVERVLEATLQQAQESALGDLSELRRAQRAATGYAPARARRPRVNADA